DALDVSDPSDEALNVRAGRKSNVELEAPTFALLAHLDRVQPDARALDLVDHRAGALAERKLDEQDPDLRAEPADDLVREDAQRIERKEDEQGRDDRAAVVPGT